MHRLARLLRVQFGRTSEKMDIAQLRLMFDEIDTPVAANDDAGSSGSAQTLAPHQRRLPSALTLAGELGATRQINQS